MKAYAGAMRGLPGRERSKIASMMPMFSALKAMPLRKPSGRSR
jgi:hypothetical protein